MNRKYHNIMGDEPFAEINGISLVSSIQSSIKMCYLYFFSLTWANNVFYFPRWNSEWIEVLIDKFRLTVNLYILQV